LITLLAELDARRLYLSEGCSSLFTFCTHVLHLSGHAAYGRITAARCARRFPVILEMLVQGDVTLTTIGLLAPHLTADNADEVLTVARRKSKRDVEHMLAELRPLPAVLSSIRKLAAPKTTPAVVPCASTPLRDGSSMQASEVPETKIAGPAAAGQPATRGPLAEPLFVHNQTSSRRAVVMPLAPDRYKVQFTMSREGHDNLRRAQDLLRHVIPDGDPAAIFDRALALLVADLERSRLGATGRPRPARKVASHSRHVPASVKRQVWARDRGQCAFVGSSGCCTERGFLELHHVVPFADGGPTVADNLELRCRAHNQYEAERWSETSLLREQRSANWNSVRT
jgi:hypothetical protein